MTHGGREGTVLAVSSGGFHRVAYIESGGGDSRRTAVCVHGITGRAADFEVLAPALARAGLRVVCVDVVGRGNSDWLTDPREYGLRQYVADLTVVLARLDVGEVDWVGTSMGGLIGMAVAAMPSSPIRRLVLNDIGPRVPSTALRRLGAYLGHDPTFDDLDAVEAHLRRVRAPCGALDDARWRRMAERYARPEADGRFRSHYDPAIAVPFREAMDRDVDMWSLWDRIACPVLVLRGTSSDLLLPETAEELTRRGPRTELIELEGCGHAPTLDVDHQTTPIVDWLT